MKNVLSKFGKQDKKIRCPRCLNVIDVPRDRATFKCTGKLYDQHGLESIPCDYIFPTLYLEHFGEATPVPVQVFGWTSHGKTVFLNALRLMLMRMRQVWPEYDYRAITDHDIDISRELRTKMEDGIMPDPTIPLDLKQNIIYIMQLNHMVRWDSRFLVIMDHAGERFDYLEDFEAHEIPFLTHKDTTTLMFLSVPLLRGQLIGQGAVEHQRERRQARLRGEDLPPEFSPHKGRSMDELLTIYIQAMITHDKHEMRSRQKGIRQRVKDIVSAIRDRRKLVVVLTMADAILSDVPHRLRDYLVNDDMWDRLFHQELVNKQDFDVNYMEKYMARMEKVSDAIREWLVTDLHDVGGGEFVASIENNNIQARYTLISSLGHNEVSMPHPEGAMTGLGSKIAPKRVLDPFFWILEYQKFRD